MMSRHVLLLTLSIATALLVLAACGGDEDPLIDKGNREIIVARVSTPPNLQAVVADPVWDDAGVKETSVWLGTDSAYTNYFGPAVLRVKAITDGTNIYFRFDWKDPTKTLQPGRWFWNIIAQRPFAQVLDTVRNTLGNFAYDAAERARQLWENEDVLAVFFDYGNNGSERANCAKTCHPADERNSIGSRHWTTGGGNIDCWVWRSGRTDPFGIAEDYFWGAERKYDSYNVELYIRNSIADSDENTDARWMHVDGTAFKGDILYTEDTTAIIRSEDFGWQDGDGVPGYIYNRPDNSSRYDVKAQSLYDPQLGVWQVVLWRTLAAPNPSEDVTFTLGGQYEATFAVMRNTLQKHSGSQPITIKLPQ